MSDEKAYLEYEQTRTSYRPAVRGRKQMVVSGRHLATQAAIRILDNTEQHRFATFSSPHSFAPHDTHPDLLRAEQRIGRRALLELEKRGHLVKMWPDWAWKAGGVCVINEDKKTGGRC